jgi:hypothetical protein
VISAQTNVFTYTIGEEVIVRLAGVSVFDVDRTQEVPRDRLPDWTIARVTSIIPGTPGTRYVLAAQRAGRTFVAIVAEESIEGIA